MSLDLISQIFEVCIVPLLGVLTAFVVKWLNIKTSEIVSKKNNELEKKYIEMLNSTISSCVVATTQTYVDTLKKEGKFDIEAQKQAFKITSENIVKLLNKEASDYLTSIIGDLELYITQKIENEIKLNKK